MQKVFFFDVKEFEFEYIRSKFPSICKPEIKEECFHLDYDEKELKDIEAISVFTGCNVTKQLLKKLPNLKFIATRSTGFSHIDVDYCKQNSIKVSNVPSYGENTIAEYAFGLLLEVSRKINLAYQDLQKGIIDTPRYLGNDLAEKTIGIIGTGRIGKNAVRIANGFNMKILAYDLYPDKTLEEKYNLKYVEIDELYKNSDVITLHAPCTKENIHMISDDEFSNMKDGVIIINTARGEIIDTEALYRALVNKKVSGAGLDVLECEDVLVNQSKYLSKIDCVKIDCLKKTLLNHKMLELENVVVTPHIAYDTKEAIERILQTTYDNVQAYLQGKPQNVIN